MTRILRKPTAPGEFLQAEFLSPLGLTQKQLADHIGVDVRTINRVVNNKQAVTAELAIKLEAAFGMDAEFWLSAQQAHDLWNARRMPRRSLPKRLIRAK